VPSWLHRNEQRVRFVAEPMSVPVARRFVADRVTGSGLAELAEDAALLATELSANAALHSHSRYFDVVVHTRPEAVRIGVADEGNVPVDAVAIRPSQLATVDDDTDLLDLFDPDAELLDLEPSTGRGLAIVAALADRWGVEVTEQGKVVWGELASARASRTVPADHPVSAESPRPRTAESIGPITVPRPRPEWVRVQLIGLPVELGKQHHDQVQDLVRELQLVTASGADWPLDLTELITGFLARHASSWRLSTAIIEQAIGEGRAEITLDLTMPSNVVADVQVLNEALGLADVLCDRHELLTLAASADLRRCRSWMTAEFVRQVREGADPVPFPDFAG
jgi:anti-sigma regulatory factor (Ser/Thr protein kinase)